MADTLRLEEGPVLVRKGEHYILRYRFAKPPEGQLVFAPAVVARRDADAGYYFFVVSDAMALSERGLPCEQPLAEDGLDDLARSGRVFWLDPDGTRHPIPVVAATP